MTPLRQPAPHSIPANRPGMRPTSSQARLFGAPIGDLGWFASLLIGTATGFAAFFFATFLGIITLLILNTATHRALDYSLAYKRIGLPIGLLTLLLAYTYLGTLWARRVLRRS